ncbi:amidohydrolase [Pararhodobacter zhoushanensis]|uniref:Amidohydrolase n=1 Tax=Pararhodobacter zhoushanensis TaxID=2479545 RepID=A0ABT3GTT6_9RHOB|nr:amidohydrolase [Pararhodobacter zhoushanensis]MCW1930947.1 amidohydrolase [Pararhodobacter zhoushanensis]
MTLTNSDIHELTEFRRALHRRPEVSGFEAETARSVTAALPAADLVVTDLGGHGVAAVYDSGQPGPTVMIRSELDALPIVELGDLPYASETPGVAHLCGHDGHSTILLGLARLLARKRPATGRVVLLFQPAEEDGSGAAAVLADPRFAGIAPDWALSLHNMPGVALGRAWLAAGPANCASAGLRITLTGGTAHASLPETGRAPTPALPALIDGLRAMGPGGAMGAGFRLATITHLRMGEPAFGIAPGEAELWVTLRGLSTEDLDALLTQAQDLARGEAEAAGLVVAFSIHDRFEACTNHPDATAVLTRALDAQGIGYDNGDMPMRGSEDFGRFGGAAKSAMVFLGSGTDHPALHTQTYDFPDALIAPGVAIFHHAITELLG